MLPNDIHHSYLVVDRGGEKKHHAAGRFMIRDGQLHILEDYHRQLKQHLTEGPIDDLTIAQLAAPPQHLEHASRSALKGGHRGHLIPEADLQPMPEPAETAPSAQMAHIPPKFPSVWHYTHSGHDRPHTLEHRDGQFMLDGNPLKHDEVATILDNVRTKTAKIRYPKGRVAEAVAKMERVYEDLFKADMDTQEAFKHLHAAAQEGHVPHEAVQALRRQIYTDPMTGGSMGNQYAWNEFKNKKQPGVYVSLDGNDFKTINDLHGHEMGDSAIKAFGHAAREALDEAVGQKQSKMFRADDQGLYRSGGDEFVVHVPTHEHAARFARALRGKLEQIPAINGSHKLSMSMGFGNDYATADKALGLAKERKYLAPAVEGAVRPRKHPVGQVPNLAHSLVPGFEGAVPLDEDQLQMVAPESVEPKPTVPEKTELPKAPPPRTA